ncbi:DMT family transporter [Clostridium sp. SYSU_GA19001]|uniref:DMT family transporter n=1 Tax=Clostridium caldaquaticum TaxID=2940653 RepID=UPI002076E2FB|nr:DMT family transporter [Clostridium caldaquaticum]MCM8709640.1 DMT family transporter [Clostridium caldaquaticum]
MMGVIFSIIAGIAMSLQGVFNTRLGDKIGTYETNVLVQSIALVLSIIALLVAGNGDFRNLKDANKLYLLGGALGVVITVTVMLGIKSLGTTCSISIILVAQLTAAALIDAFGLFDSTKVVFGTTKIIGVILMIAGILIFKCKC